MGRSRFSPGALSLQAERSLSGVFALRRGERHSPRGGGRAGGSWEVWGMSCGRQDGSGHLCWVGPFSTSVLSEPDLSRPPLPPAYHLHNRSGTSLEGGSKNGKPTAVS